MRDEFVPYVPPPEKIIEIYERLDKGETLELAWKCPGRRPPTPEVEERPEEEEAAPVEEENKDFDFEEEGGGLVTPQRRNPGAELKGSARKLTASLDSVLSNMKRHRQIDQMDETDTPKKA